MCRYYPPSNFWTLTELDRKKDHNVGLIYYLKGLIGLKYHAKNSIDIFDWLSWLHEKLISRRQAFNRSLQSSSRCLPTNVNASMTH